MLVKIGNTLYNPSQFPIMLILSEQDKINISQMLDGNTKYAIYPDGYFAAQKDVLDWMGVDRIDKEWKGENE